VRRRVDARRPFVASLPPPCSLPGRALRAPAGPIGVAVETRTSPTPVPQHNRTASALSRARARVRCAASCAHDWEVENEQDDVATTGGESHRDDRR
jgi:hypothetical protein